MLSLVFLLSLAIYWLNAEDMKGRAVSADTDNKRIVVLDAGHGGEDPGAVSKFCNNKEKELNLIIAEKVKKLLEDEGVKVIMTRTRDILNYSKSSKTILQKRKEDLLKRKNIMDNSSADIAVSIHMNEFKEEKYWGIQAFYPPNSAKSECLAMTLQDTMREMVQPTSTRQALINDRGIIIFRELKTPTAVVECGFLSNRDEDSKLSTDEHRQKIAEAIKAGILKYFDTPQAETQ